MVRFLVALDGSENSFSALANTLRFIKPQDELHVTHVIEDMRGRAKVNTAQ